MSLQKEEAHMIPTGQEKDLDLFIPVLYLTHVVTFLLLQATA